QKLQNATASFWCMILGLEMEHGGVELRADWHINNINRPILLTTPSPFRPRPSLDHQQVRVRIRNNVWKKFEYLFHTRPLGWLPQFEQQSPIQVSEADRDFLTGVVPPETGDWFLVRGLERDEEIAPSETRRRHALRLMSPEGGSFVMMSSRRRDLSRQ